MSLFESKLFSFCKPQSKLDLPTLRHGIREGKNATDQIKDMTLARIYIYIYMCAIYMCVCVYVYIYMCVYVYIYVYIYIYINANNLLNTMPY